MVLDGMAPPDMVLPASFSPDGQAALDAVFTACEADAACAARHPALRQRWRDLLAALPREVTVNHPLTGTPERLTLTRDVLAGQVRGALYVPATAAVLPAALERATQGDVGPLMAMSLSQASRRETSLALGLHLSVVCAEDVPRLAQATDRPGADFGTQYLDFYTRACAEWPRGEVSEAFYRVAPLAAPVLALSGGADPVTPPRHGERVVKALGPAARHAVVPQAGHGVMGLQCMRDVLFRFINAPTAEAAAAVPVDCAAALPRPPAVAPVSAPSASGAPR
jgi:pimeloyl-ACP methyl ester carboxylesterase